MYGFLNKSFQEIIYLSIVHSYKHDCETTAREIFRNSSDGLLAFELTLNNWSVVVQYVFHCHSRIFQCATFFPITRTLNTAWMKFDAFIYTFYPRWKKVSIKNMKEFSLILTTPVAFSSLSLALNKTF